MTVRELIGQLSQYANQKIRHVVTESGEDVLDINQDGEQVILLAQPAYKGITVDEFIEKLRLCDGEKEVVTNRKAEISGVGYEHVVYPEIFLRHHN